MCVFVGFRAVKGLPVYAASKWGVIGFTTSMAASLLLYNITWDGKCMCVKFN